MDLLNGRVVFELVLVVFVRRRERFNGLTQWITIEGTCLVSFCHLKCVVYEYHVDTVAGFSQSL